MDMALTTAAALGPSAGTTWPQESATKQDAHGLTFHELLADLNPLQHIPVIGTIYRAITGDEIPEAARNLGSLAVSGIMGGPLGLASNLAFLALRKLTGIDIDRIGQDLLADIGIGHHADRPAGGALAQTPEDAPPHAPMLLDAGTRTTAWSPMQLKAYGVSNEANGDLRHGASWGSDVLNGLLLAELHLAGGPSGNSADTRVTLG
jgi:hypothetical protein